MFFGLVVVLILVLLIEKSVLKHNQKGIEDEHAYAYDDNIIAAI